MATPTGICSLPVETQSRICQALSSSHLGQKSAPRRDLVSLALTCRSLSEPAFDTLWSSLHSLAPLLRTLPEDLCTSIPFLYPGTNGHAPVTGSQLVLLRAPERQDFARFFLYSRRVKRVGRDESARDPFSGEYVPSGSDGFTLNSHHRVPTAVWNSLSEFAHKPLLPNLHFLHHREWEHRCGIDYRDTPIHSADMLFGPKLKEARIHFAQPFGASDRTTELVRVLSNIAPNLEYLSTEVSPFFSFSRATGSLHCPELHLFHRLTTFSGRTVRVAPASLIALAHLPCLESVLLHVNSAEYSWDALPHERSPAFFPALLQITLHKIDFHWCTASLRLLSSSPLTRLSIRCEDHWLPPPDLFEALCDEISELPCASSIVDLFITIGTPAVEAYSSGLGDTDGEIYWPEDIAPLLTGTLSSLQRLVIQGECIAIADDATLEAISLNCPNIVELALKWDHSRCPRPDAERSPADDDFPYATPAGLLHLARRCPRLAKLAVAVDMRSFTPASASAPDPYFDDGPGGGTVPPVPLSGPAVSALQHFDASGSVGGDGAEARVAALLSLLFPRLVDISSRFAPRAWWDVSELHAKFVRVRGQERACAERERRRLGMPVAAA